MLNKQGGGIKNLMDQSLYEEKKLDTLVILVGQVLHWHLWVQAYTEKNRAEATLDSSPFGDKLKVKLILIPSKCKSVHICPWLDVQEMTNSGK